MSAMVDGGSNGATVNARQKLIERLGFDPEEMRRKYREERDKRLGPEADRQFTKMEGGLEELATDPHVKEPISRAPLQDEVEAVVVGGGLSGLVIATRLRQSGLRKVRIIEAGGDLGGSWYWNDYPGIMCDVESYIYMPMLEEMGYVPTERYASGPEIQRHCRAIGEKFGLYEDACFQTQVTEMHWSDEDARWTVQTDRDDVITAQFVIVAIGGLNRGRLPQLPGLEKFSGRTFHTSRWDYDYTGGDYKGGLTGLKDKRVGMIGTGATAVQVAPHLGQWAKEFFVFQRTPASVDIRANRPTDSEWAKSLEPGWQYDRMENFNRITSGIPVEHDAVNDGWTDNFKTLYLGDGAKKFEDLGLSPAELGEAADFQKMADIRERVASIVKDPETAQALMPYFPQFCKRPCFHDEYLENFNRPNVHLVDTMGRGVEAFTEKGVMVGGKEYELDCVVFATGFEPNVRAPRFTNVGGFEIYGRDGLKLSEKWSAGARSLHGQHVHGFPNLMIVSPIQSAYAFNWLYIINGQAAQVEYIIREAKARGLRTFEVTEPAEQEWVNKIIERSGVQRDFLASCTPGYFNGEGKLSDTIVVDSAYAGGNVDYFEELKKWREAGTLSGLQLEN